MTPEQTRQLGIEFERRVQAMIPETEHINKLDTETIYSYLNQYQDKIIADLYRSVDQIPVSNNQQYIETLLRTLKSSTNESYVKTVGIASYKLPSDFGLYIDSYSAVNNSYEYKGDGSSGVVPNQLIAAKDVANVLSRPQDNMKILRNPIAWISEGNKLSVMYDRYTIPVRIHIDYYRLPKYMNPLNSQECELPMEMFEQLVSGAVDLYVQYVAGAEARKRQLAEQQRQQQKKQEDDK